MIPKSVEDFRKEYRTHYIGRRYSGWGHFSFTLVGASITILFALSRISNPSLAELLVVPFTFLYANLVEYFGHKGPMHRPTKFLWLIFQRHTVEHHRFYTHEVMAAESSRDFKMVLFPPEMLVFFLGGFAIPVATLLYLKTTPNIAFLFVATAMGYMLNYEMFHWAYHQPDGHWVRSLPWMNKLRQLHLNHHNPALMSRYNFNITYPICDAVFRTHYEPVERLASNPAYNKQR